MEPTPRNVPELGKTVGASALSGGREAALPLQGGDVVQYRPSQPLSGQYLAWRE